jgi:hypothetical protein
VIGVATLHDERETGQQYDERREIHRASMRDGP